MYYILSFFDASLIGGWSPSSSSFYLDDDVCLGMTKWWFSIAFHFSVQKLFSWIPFAPSDGSAVTVLISLTSTCSCTDNAASHCYALLKGSMLTCNVYKYL